MTESEEWTVGQLLTFTTDYLKKNGSDSPRLDAEVLLAVARGCKRIELYTTFDQVASDETRTAFRELVRRRAEGTPVAYLVGKREFYSLSFRVTPDVLVPRPETELLVVRLIDLVKILAADRRGPEDEDAFEPRIADVGTGSGIIAVCAAKLLPEARITAIDSSPAALAVARQNAADHDVVNQIDFVHSDLFAAVDPPQRYHIIASNPPYVAESEFDKLPPSVRNFEPRAALVAGPRGTEVIERLVPQAAERLEQGGWLLMEVSPMIEPAVREIIEKHGGFELGPTIKDLAGHSRIVQAKRIGKQPDRVGREIDMDVITIQGGRALHGTVAAAGSKNAALPIMAACIMAEAPVVLDRVPQVTDVDTLALLLGHLGVEVKRRADGRVHLHTVDAALVTADAELVGRMRASFCVLGPLLARRKRAIVPLPGGCRIGPRPVDVHLRGLTALGTDFRIERGFVVAQAKQLRGTTIDLAGPQGPTVTGTANVLMAAVTARGETILQNVALEPEVVDLGEFLISAGAHIEGLGTSKLKIVGVDQLGGGDYQIIPDRIETGTLLAAGAITGGGVTVEDCRPDHLLEVLEYLSEAGCKIDTGSDWIYAAAPPRLRPFHLTALPYPGVPTDLQAQFMALAALAGGASTIIDSVFPNRFAHVAELRRLGAKIKHCGAIAVIEGIAKLQGGEVTASDLRASAALVLAGLAANGRTTIQHTHHLHRGYDRLIEKLQSLGANIALQREMPISQRRVLGPGQLAALAR